MYIGKFIFNKVQYVTKFQRNKVYTSQSLYFTKFIRNKVYNYKLLRYIFKVNIFCNQAYSL